MSKVSKFIPLDHPLFHPDHPRPRTRRDLISQGFMIGAGAAAMSPLAMFSSRVAADLSITAPNGCQVGALGNNKIPFICFDLAGGANIAGSNVLVGREGGQLDLLDTAGYNKQGLPGDQIPVISVDPAVPNSFVAEDFGLRFHEDSQMLRGMREKAGTIPGGATALNNAAPNTSGAVIPARSQNDTGNNPHNPMYGIAMAGDVRDSGSGDLLGLGGAMGLVTSLVGSRNSDSGGNSMAPASLIDLAFRPTKVDRPSDATGLVDLGGLLNLPGGQAERVAILEAAFRISAEKMGNVSTGLTGNTGFGDIDDQTLRDAISCAYAQSADLADTFSDSSDLDPLADLVINGEIFTEQELNGDREFSKTASIMKLVIDGLAGAGTITMGGYDYHTGNRTTGDARDLRAGRCIGACLAYAASQNKPVMIYVVSDGSVFSNGMIDGNVGKGVWTGDSQQTASAFFLVYNPNGRPTLNSTGATTPEQHQQLGWMRGSGDVETVSSPAANNVETLVDMVTLNYMALHDEVNNGLYSTKFPGNGIGSDLDRWTAFEPIYNGTLANPY